MSKNSTYLSKVNEATGLSLTASDLELIFSMQTDQQHEQYINDLDIAVLLYQDAMAHNGMMTEKATPVWKEVNARIALWSSWAGMATPVRRGFFSRKEIPFFYKITLKRLLSPDCEFIKSGKLGL